MPKRARIHKAKRIKKRPEPEYRKLYRLKRWQRESRAYLDANPLCAQCGKPSQVTDHVKKHVGNLLLFWDAGNWQPLCIKCHNRKSGRGE